MSTDRSTQAERPMVDMKAHILTVASGLILEKGIKDMSLKDIAKTAGISKGTLYYYYSAKEDIIYDIAERNMRQITDEILAWIKEDSETEPDAILRSLFQKVLAADTRGRLHLYLLNNALTSNEKLAENFCKLYVEWRAMLSDNLVKILPGEKEKADALSYLILAAIDGLMIQKMCGASEIPVSEIISLMLK